MIEKLSAYVTTEQDRCTLTVRYRCTTEEDRKLVSELANTETFLPSRINAEIVMALREEVTRLEGELTVARRQLAAFRAKEKINGKSG